MKNNIIRIAIFALVGALALTGCEQGLEETHDGITGTRIAVTAQTEVDAATRTALDGFTTEWVAGDKIGVFSSKAEATNVQLTATSSSESSAFDGDLFWGTGAHDFYAYYPHTSGTFAHTAVPVSLPATQTQSAGGNSGHIAALDFMVAAPLSDVSAGGAVQFQFAHPFSLLEFKVVGEGSLSSIELTAPAGTRLAFSGGTIDIAQAKPSGAYTISGGTASRSVTLNVTAPMTLTESKSTTPALYMMVSPANLSGGEITVTATIDGEEKTITANGFNIARGRKYTLVVDPNKGVEPEDNVLALIPDPVFLAYCQSQMTTWDTNRDGELSFTEAAAVKQIDCMKAEDYTGDKIASAAGIEYFTGLQYLDFSGNELSSLDVSNSTALIYLYCENNQLTSLNVSANTALIDFWCFNNQLTLLDVSVCTNLERLCCENNQLSSLNVPKSTALIYLYCGNNQLTALDISKNTALIILLCESNKLTSLDVTKNIELIRLDCFNNQLTSLYVSKNTVLMNLFCENNQITSLDVSNNTALTWLNCYNNQLTSLDVSKNADLIYLNCGGNQLTSLDISTNTALEEFLCWRNQLTSLDVTKNTALTSLTCHSNALTALDVSKNTALTNLYCENNQLTSLDISRNTALTYMNCERNPGDGVSRFPVEAWFDNNAIPANFTTGSWYSNGKTIAIDYYTGDVPLVLSVDKGAIFADGSDAATFTVKRLGVDVTSEVQICLPNGTCLIGNTFTTSTAGEYEFYAYYTSDPENKSNTVTVTALDGVVEGDFDPTQKLHKNVTFFTFTATWCGPCYLFKGYMKNVVADYGDNIVALNFYTSDSETSVASTIENTFRSQLSAEGRFNVTGYPTAFAELDLEVGTPGYVPTEAQARDAYSKYVAYPAKTGIRVESSIVGDKVNAMVTVGAQDADTYQIGALLIEDNIVDYQNGGGDNYNHTNVLRAKAMDNIFGETLGTMSVGETLSKPYSFDIAAGYNRSNLYIVIYTLYKNSSGKWMIANSVKAPVDGITDFKYDDGSGNQLYESTDYSQDKKVTVLQQATAGNGIDIVLMGDGYSDRQIAAGNYANDMETIYTNLFTEEPYKSFKNLFNVYYVTAVSANEGYGTGKSTVFSGWFEGGGSTLVGGTDAVCFEYAQKAISSSRMNEALIVVSMNSTEYAGTCWMYYPGSVADPYGNGVSVAYFPKGSDAATFAQLLHHEANGHGFAKLADEYAYDGTVPASKVTDTRTQQTNWGWWKNIDFTSDLSTIRWNYFLSDPRYEGQGLGAFEGGLTYATGAWRPTFNSVMRYNYGGFNAPSREAIYYRIHKLAYGTSWVYNYEDFVAWDLAHYSVTYEAQALGQGVLKPREYTHPPVVVPRMWNESAPLIKQARIR